MNNHTISFLTIGLYGISTVFYYLEKLRKLALSPLFRAAYWISLALLLHGFLLYRWIDTPQGQNLSLSHLFSLSLWLMLLVLFGMARFKPIRTLSLFVYPLAMLSIALALEFPGFSFLQTKASPYLLIHILIAILAFAFLSMGLLQAVLLYLQNQCLKNHTQQRFKLIQQLPPLETMETLFFQMIKILFLSLSILMISTLLFLKSPTDNAYFQKTTLSLLSWGLLGGLLVSHTRFGIRGPKAIVWTLAAIAILLLAYTKGYQH